MKVAFVGKGGSGKTTLSALFARYLAEVAPVVAVDADINQHLGVALGLDEQAAGSVPALGEHLKAAKEFLRGTNPRIRRAAEMVKTTPPGRGSRLLSVNGDDPFHRDWAVPAGKVRLLATGPFADEDLGVSCYHAKTGAVELYLNHLLDGPGEYVVVDMTAGADSFASGLFTRFDLTFLIAEPTRRGVSVYRQYLDYARGYDVALRVIGNKVADEADIRYLRTHVGEDLLGWLTVSGYVRAAEQGHLGPLDALEPENAAVLATMRGAVDRRVKDWGTFQRQAELFHVRNALAWANTAIGIDLRGQIDLLHPRASGIGSARGARARCRLTLGPASSTALRQSRADPTLHTPDERNPTMSLDVSDELLAQAEAGEVDPAAFLDTVRTSLPYAYAMVERLAADLAAGRTADGFGFVDNSTAPETEAERGQLLRALASNAIRSSLEAHFGVALAFQNCHRLAVFPAGTEGSAQYRKFVSERAQLLNQSPLLRDC